jgi:hypothetical protein
MWNSAVKSTFMHFAAQLRKVESDASALQGLSELLIPDTIRKKLVTKMKYEWRDISTHQGCTKLVVFLPTESHSL